MKKIAHSAAATWLASIPYRYARIPYTGTKNQINAIRIRQLPRLINSVAAGYPSPCRMLFSVVHKNINGHMKLNVRI